MLMQIEYELTADDMTAFQWRAAYNSRMARKARRTVYIFWFVLVILISILPAWGEDGFSIERVDFIFMFVAFAIVALLQWAVGRWLMRRAVREVVNDLKRDKGQVGRHRIVLDEAGVFESTIVGEMRTSWAGIDRLEQDRDYIFIYTQPHASHVIPKRAFSSPQEADGFFELARLNKESNQVKG